MNSLYIYRTIYQRTSERARAFMLSLKADRLFQKKLNFADSRVIDSRQFFKRLYFIFFNFPSRALIEL